MPFRIVVFALFLPAAFGAAWTTFQDPIEKAFTVDVPPGWTVKGGLFRMGYSDYRPMVDLRSPDGKVSVRLGDVSIPTYSVPNQIHSREGGVVDLGEQAQLTVARLRNGQEYASLYARSRFKDVCKTLTPQAVNGPPPVPDQPETPDVQGVSPGQAAFSCDGRTAYVYDKVASYGAFWQVHSLMSFLAPPDQVPAARAIIEQAAKSFKLSEQWMEYQKRLDQQALVYQQARQQARRRALSQQVAQFEMQMQAMRSQVASFERRQQAQAAQVTAWGNILTGITPTTDPLGNPHDVWTGTKSRYWTDGRGNYVNANDSPGAGWQELRPRQ